jgi:hypothetical protein
MTKEVVRVVYESREHVGLTSRRGQRHVNQEECGRAAEFTVIQVQGEVGSMRTYRSIPNGCVGSTLGVSWRSIEPK